MVRVPVTAAAVSLSPVEKIGPLYFKREDLAGGQKGRQLKFMVQDYLATSPPPHGLLSAAPGVSPQTVFAAREARTFGIPCLVVVGTNTLERARRFPNVKIAKALGAQVVVAGASQNNWRRNKRLKELQAEHPTYFKVPEGLGPCREDPDWQRRFYLNSAVQVQNLPPLRTLIIPCGSGNSAISILLGLALYLQDQLPENIVLAVLGTDPSGRMRKTVDRHILQGLESNKLALRLYESAERLPVHPVNEYGAKVRPFQSYGGIDFHPNYEGKMWKVLSENCPHLLVEGTGVWIVGGEPRMDQFSPPA